MSRSFLTNINLNKNQLLNAAIQPLSQAPQNPVIGQIYFDTGINALRQWTGTEWIDYLSSADGNQYIESVGDNLNVAAGNLTLGSKVVIDDASQTLTNKELGSGTTLGADLSGVDTYKITNLVNPADPQDAATKAYVDATAQGLNVKLSVRIAALGNVDITDIGSYKLSNTYWTFGEGNSFAMTAGSFRILLKDQDIASENGIYFITDDGNGNFTIARAEDQQTVDQGDYTFVESGLYQAQGYIVTQAGIGPFGSVWTQFSAAGEYVAGTGIDISGNTIATKLGTGLTTDGSNNITFATGYGVRKYTVSNPELIASGGVVSWDINHALGNPVVQVAVFNNNSPVEVDVTITDANNINLSWVSATVSADTFTAFIIG